MLAPLPTLPPLSLVLCYPPPPRSLKDYFQYFTPFIVTALLPTAISSQWRKIDSHRLTRDEQTWLSTTYVQIYAFLQVRGRQGYGGGGQAGRRREGKGRERDVFMISPRCSCRLA